MNSVLFMIIISYQLLVFITHYHLSSITKKTACTNNPKGRHHYIVTRIASHIIPYIYIYSKKYICYIFVSSIIYSFYFHPKQALLLIIKLLYMHL